MIDSLPKMLFYRSTLPDDYVQPYLRTEKEIRDELMNYHETYGKDGFGSERTHLDTIELRIENELKRNVGMVVSFIIKHAIIKAEDDIIKFESQPDFIAWINVKKKEQDA